MYYGKTDIAVANVVIKNIKSEKIFRVLVISVEIRRENYAGKIR